MNKSDVLKFAGEVSIKKFDLISLSGTRINVINQIVSIEIYEDIFSAFITLNVVLQESLDFLGLMNFSGEEYIDVIIDTPTLKIPIKGKFYIYKIADRLLTAEREVTYTLKAISVEFINDANYIVNKAISGNIADSALSLIREDGLNSEKGALVEKTSNSTKFVSNNWSPSKCLSILASGAVSTERSASYLFFENRNGFNFISIESLLDFPVYQKFVKDNYTRNMIGDGTDAVFDIKKDYMRITNIDVPVLTNYMDSIKSGQLKSRLVTYDSVTKKYTSKNFNVLNKKTKLLNDLALYSNNALANPSSTIILMPKAHSLYTKYTDTTNSKTVQERMSFFENIKKYCINISVFGRTDYTPGLIVELNIPKTAQITKEEDYKDYMLSGKYLVSAVSHMITRERHECTLELIKNSVLKKGK